MAVEFKLLFHPEVMRQQVRSFIPPEHVPAWQSKLRPRAGLVESGRADAFKETALLPDFLDDILCDLLGRSSPAVSPDSFTLSRECRVEVDGRTAT